MIKFFRKTRYNLMEKNKTGKYFKYAIGEIILVVIGILIALQINNFNNERQQREIEHVYLLSLQTEFKTNLNKINKSILENKERINATENMLTLFDNKILDTITDNEISNMIHSVVATEATYQPSKGVLTDIISSGNLNLIKNKQLRQYLASFESKLDFMQKQESNTLSTKKAIKGVLIKNGSIRMVIKSKGVNFEHQSISDTINNKQLFSSVEFENNLLDYYLTIKATNTGPRFFGGIKEQIELILGEIDSELKK